MKHLIYLIIIFIFLPATVNAGVLLHKSDLTYLGAFRVPDGNLGGSSKLNPTMGRGGKGLTYNTANNTLLVITSKFENDVVEINIPNDSVLDPNVTSVWSLTKTTVHQVPHYPTASWGALSLSESDWDALNLNSTYSTEFNGSRPTGLLVYHGRLIGAAHANYPSSSNIAHLSHFANTVNWTTEPDEDTGMQWLGVSPLGANKSDGGFVGGFMGLVPPEWQDKLGYPALTGMGPVSIISRGTNGPSFSGFNPDDIGKTEYLQPNITPATMFVGYPSGHQTLGAYGSPAGNLNYSQVSLISGVTFPSGSDSVLVWGRHGYGYDGQGSTCYGQGTWDITLHGTPYNNFVYCYDPPNQTEGCHGYPYYNQVWAYDANDLLAVKEGHIVTAQDVTKQRFKAGIYPNNSVLAEGQTVQPWNVIPYATWDFNLPFATNPDSGSNGMKDLGGVAYDPSTQRIYISQLQTDIVANAYEIPPIIHVFQVNLDNVSDTLAPGSPNGLSVW